MILAIVQARVSSARLPGKVLAPVLGRPMILRQVERAVRAERIDKLLVATSTDASDDALEAELMAAGVICFRGSLDDVLDRFYRAAAADQPEHVVRLTGDCPLADPELIDDVIDFHLAGRYDYTSDALEPTFPDGLDAEVFRFSCLETAFFEARLPSEREHVTPFMYSHPDRFRIGSYKGDRDLSHLRWSVDEPADLEFVRLVYEQLYPARPSFTTADVLALIAAHPELAAVNAKIPRNEGLARSREADAEHGSTSEKG